ncbi:TapB family protein [Zeaxanthinibacter enoshimensis]|uniref:DUF3108 domain-containing protein n=1 Tax=Zeaxanthinibacter enoshimensis TaxID=392009 RepID=A0A4R6TQF4_9FLAO|nr:hypothetical protein [Zeaxanthinibacter enoshimensis]TDQ33420.1 hypothetical protein CLV82_1260 [Zeaxanthinibacter enoshimensis]
MKNLLLMLIALAVTSVHSYSQDCSKYYPLQEGSRLEYTNYDKKDKPDGTVTYEVISSENTSDGTTALMQMSLRDQDGEEVMQSEYEIRCKDDIVQIDFKSLMNQQMMEQFKEMEVELSGTDIELPNNLSVGQSLDDADLNMKMNMGAMNMNMNVQTINRKVEKKETVTTPAGTFDCFVIYSETKTKMMMANQTFPSRTWFAEGVGMIKQESYNKKGNTIGKMELTAYSN